MPYFAPGACTRTHGLWSHYNYRCGTCLQHISRHKSGPPRLTWCLTAADQGMQLDMAALFAIAMDQGQETAAEGYNSAGAPYTSTAGCCALQSEVHSKDETFEASPACMCCETVR
jgi:hypothetical protein